MDVFWLLPALLMTLLLCTTVFLAKGMHQAVAKFDDRNGAKARATRT